MGRAGFGGAVDRARQQQSDTVKINGVTYRHVGNGVYEAPWGERGVVATEPGGYLGAPSTQVFDPLPSDLQPWNAPGTSGPSYPPAHLDPRYWALQERELDQQLLQMGFTNENQRKQILAQLIASRNNLAGDVANTSANVAKTAADYAANPRDAVAELMYRNQTGPNAFGDISGEGFGEYGKALAEKGASIFGPVWQDINQARLYRDAIPPSEFLSDIPAASAPAAGGAPAPNGLQMLMDQLATFNPQQKSDFANYTTGGQAGTQPTDFERTLSMAGGGKLDFEPMFKRDQPGFSPSSSEGGTNLDIHERALVIGESGHVYATLGEKRPDGTMRAEQLQIKPLKSEVEKDKKLQEANKKVVETQQQTMAAFQQGGTVNATPDDFMEQLRQYLGGLGGAGGGTGAFDSPLPSPRLLAGAPYSALLDDPDALDMTFSGFSALGVSPRQLQAQIRRYSPSSVQNNFPRVSFA